MKLIVTLKHFIVATLFLNPGLLLSAAASISENNLIPFPVAETIHHNGPGARSTAKMEELKEIIRGMNARIHELFGSISRDQTEEEREAIALQLVEIMDFYFSYEMEKKLYELAVFAANEKEQEYLRLMAIQVLGENIIPNSDITQLLEAILIYEKPSILQAVKETLRRLRQAYSAFSKKNFAKLFHYKSTNAMRAAALIWIAIHEKNPHAGEHLFKLVAGKNSNPQLGFVIVKELRERNNNLIGDHIIQELIKNQGWHSRISLSEPRSEIKEEKVESSGPYLTDDENGTETCGESFRPSNLVPLQSFRQNRP